MRFVKLARGEFGTIDAVRRLFREVIPKRTPPGKFRVTPGHIARDGLKPDEPLVFVYRTRVVLTARADSELLPNDDEERQRCPSYFVVNLDTLSEADVDLYEVERQYNEAAGADVGLVGQSWNRLPDSAHTRAVWTWLRGA